METGSGKTMMAVMLIDEIGQAIKSSGDNKLTTPVLKWRSIMEPRGLMHGIRSIRKRNFKPMMYWL
ncbi:hypothetical protein RchiOBHm_Chr6g0312091 [Rosa chinensis]|uniref:Uncharacterized protein n=1 Tax=Rosa chinensis TaxID=74649 RepID=A0A2P6Q1K4_ROSCH|nr:hypothetical protein RchiOBHm_Chr6g0312091 [Rosa chinensis]